MPKLCNTVPQNTKIPSEACRSKNVYYPTRKSRFFERKFVFGTAATRLVVEFVDNDAYCGNVTKSPFNFMNYNISFVCIYRDGTQIPSSPLRPDFENNKFIRSYLRLFSQTSQYFADTGLALSRSDVGGGYTLFAFDLPPQLNSSNPTFELIKKVILAWRFISLMRHLAR